MALNRRFNSPTEDRHPIFQQVADLAEPPADWRMAFGWTLLRDGANGRPPHVWAVGYPDRNHLLAAVAALLTYGCIANLDVNESVLMNQKAADGATSVDNLRAGFELGKQLSPHLAHTQPVRWLAVHFSERMRDECRGDWEKAWRTVIWPSMGIFGTAVELGLPVGIVNDHQLQQGELDGYAVIFTPDREALPPKEKQSLNQFEQNGGIVSSGVEGWDRKATQRAASQKAHKLIEQFFLAAPSIIQINAPADVHAVAYRKNNELTVAITNQFHFVQLSSPRKIKNFAKRGKQIKVKQAPNPVNDVTISVRGRIRNITDLITGEALAVADTISLPAFNPIALIRIDLSDPQV